MEIFKLLAISLLFVLIAVGALSVRLLFVKNGRFSGGSCNSTAGPDRRTFTCGCGKDEPCGTGNRE